MSKKISKAQSTKTTGAKSASKSKAPVVKRVLVKGRNEHGGALSRTARIETLLWGAKAPMTVRQIEDALKDVKAVRNHVRTLYGRQLLDVKDGAYFVRPSVRKSLSK